MKRLVWVAALAMTAPSGAQPTAPPVDEPLTCLFEAVSAEQRVLASPAASQRLTDGPADGEQRGGAALHTILASVPRCAAAGHWTDNQRELAQLYVLAQLAREDMRRRYAAQNVDLSFMDDPVVAAGASAPIFDDFVARVRAQGVTGERPDSAEDIVFIYFQLAAQANEIRARFNDPEFQPR